MSLQGSATGKIITVTGAISPEALGFTLPHEHVMSTFGADPSRYPDYDQPVMLKSILPYLEKVKSLGCCSILDCTAAYFGRHPELLRQVSSASGIQILTNTGYYAAANDRYVPAHAIRETAGQIARRWVREFEDSIDETGIRPGFIKTAVDEGGFSDLDRKLLKAAILAHHQTGLTIQTHTGANIDAAMAILEMLAQENVHPSAWVWVHAHSITEVSPLLLAAQQGAWVSLDGISPGSAKHILGLLQTLQARDCLSHILLSHDGDSYNAGDFRPYHFLMTDFLPLMVQAGFSKEEIHRLTVENPARAFTIQVRPR